MYNFLDESSSYALQSSDRHAVIESEQKERSKDHMNRILEQQYASEKRRREYSAFATESKDFLLEYSLYNLFSKCIPSNIDESLSAYGRNVIRNFVKEEGTSKLLSDFKTKTLYLSELAYIIESTHKQILHDTEDKEGPFKISGSAYKEFSKKLDRMSSSQITIFFVICELKLCAYK